MIRFFDLLISFLGLILFSPILVLASLLIIFDTKFPVLYKQSRVGLLNRDFELYKFRTMKVNTESNSFLTTDPEANRITSAGRILRKFKIDELPQLWNVLKGDMSFVGPRPELRKYVDLYNEEQKEILNVKPGITDYATIKFINEEELLAKSDNPEKLYINKILPEKILLNRLYLNNIKVTEYFKIIFLTIYYIIRQRQGETKP